MGFYLYKVYSPTPFDFLEILGRSITIWRLYISYQGDPVFLKNAHCLTGIMVVGLSLLLSHSGLLDIMKVPFYGIFSDSTQFIGYLHCFLAPVFCLPMKRS